MLSIGLISLSSKQAVVIDLRTIKDTHKLKKNVRIGILKEDMTFFNTCLYAKIN